MSGLSTRSLRRLRRAVEAARQERRSLALPEILALACGLGIPGRVTVDLRAAEVLGYPLVLLEPPRRTVELEGLSPREREVAGLVAAGFGNRAIAERLGISVGTVKHHVHRVLEKTGARSRTALAASIHR